MAVKCGIRWGWNRPLDCMATPIISRNLRRTGVLRVGKLLAVPAAIVFIAYLASRIM